MNKRLTRSSTDRMLAGVCGGLGAFFGIDSTWIRLAFIFLLPFTYFLPALVYVISVFLIPEKRNIQETDYNRTKRRMKSPKKYY
ncbi:PspC domain-containing protein [Companilactobacillus suantsaicola]|uniref:PspC domain-containing protein n=1 Tax=Companilactobacillus suantsaicola TaxID=2487723 RepID=A0A4Z0JPZ3_9LACO|nr:PspC domain-containing protein [Companilactobacillus suantsaicola]TGD25072.1 PspC domain-containing protein [Companilactobacillus suantsaicola]